jgi:exodeoxyribonuclease-5
LPYPPISKKKRIVKKDPVVDLSVLNGDQRAAYDQLVKFIKDPTDVSVYVLKGWAGTGKTFCISFFIKSVLYEFFPNKDWYKIAVTGPTNKSVRVIKQTSGLYHHRITFSTIHKLLGLKERITMEGKQEFVNDGDFKPAINSMRLLIIDEVSMLNDDLFEEILKYRGKLKIICMGDPAQIPPVGRPDCIPFRDELADEYVIKTLELKTIMRQKVDNPIIESSVLIRSNIGNPNPVVPPKTRINPNGEGIEFLNLADPGVRKGFRQILESYFKSKEFEINPEYVKIIAWRNKTVATMNSLVREVIYGEMAKSSKILKGERLIANNPIIWMEQILFNTNDEFTVDSFEIKVEKEYTETGPVELKYYEARVKYLDDNWEECYNTIDILHEDSEAEFNLIANGLKAKAIALKGKERSWLAYYNFLRKFADVNFSYSITAHKSQGSTYSVTFVMEDDIRMNLDIVERNRIKYTAYTRASRKVYVLRKF